MEPACENGGYCGGSDGQPWWFGVLVIAAFLVVVFAIHYWRENASGKCEHGMRAPCAVCLQYGGVWYLKVGNGPSRFFVGPYSSEKEMHRAWQTVRSAQPDRLTEADIKRLRAEGIAVP